MQSDLHVKNLPHFGEPLNILREIPREVGKLIKKIEKFLFLLTLCLHLPLCFLRFLALLLQGLRSLPSQLRSFAASQLRSFAASQLRSFAASQLRSFAASQRENEAGGREAA
jgi:hypothetical protein